MKSSLKQPGKLARFRSLSSSEKRLLVRVLAVLTAYKGLLLVFPFHRFMTNPKAIARARIAPIDERRIDATVWAIRVISSRIPLGFTCLVQALAAKWLLRREPDIQIRIGVQKNESNDFSAHAWVIYKNKTILGEQTNQVFEPILEWK